MAEVSPGAGEMKGNRQPFSPWRLLWIFAGSFIGVVAGQIIELQLAGAPQGQRLGAGGLVGGAIGALLGNYLGSRKRRSQ